MGTAEHDVIVVGAGFSGLYVSYLLRQRGFKVQGFERGDDVGGTWYWNRYPGCRCDVESMEYSYQFDEALEQDWVWPERYSAQPEILSYANHVADRYELRPLFQFGASVARADYLADKRWRVTLECGDTHTAHHLIMATGCLSSANIPAFEGLSDFSGDVYHTGQWPKAGVDFAGLDVGIIGTGSSAIQSIPLIAAQAKTLTVFQRTPNYSVPAQNQPLTAGAAARVKGMYRELRARNYAQPAAFGAEYPRRTDSALDATPEERLERFEAYWQLGGFMFLGAFADLGSNPEANALAAEFVRGKIRATVNDPVTAELLCPTNMIGCKRLCADTGYFETYNRDNVRLVDVSRAPIDRLTPAGLVTGGEAFAFDAIVFATGFDAMTGALLRANIHGKDGLELSDAWANGPRTYLGVGVAGFPNLYMMTGPGSPSVLANMITGAEQHAEFITDFICWQRENGYTAAEPQVAAQDQWVAVVNQRSEQTFYPTCNSWYLGANVPGKPRVFMPFIGFPDYVSAVQKMVVNGYEGYAFS